VRLHPQTGAMKVYDAPCGRGPYGTPPPRMGEVYCASLAGSYIARIDTHTGHATTIAPHSRPGRPPYLIRLEEPGVGKRVELWAGERL